MRLISLTQGQVAIIDDEDFDRVNQYKWFARKTKWGYYAARGYVAGLRDKNNLSRKKANQIIKIIWMHRFILDISENMEVDHKDHNGLNNQKNNLRACTPTQNMQNRKPRMGKLYKGVSFLKGKQYHKSPWRAQASINGKTIYFGHYKTAKEAAIAYNQHIKELFGDFAYLNPLD